MCMYILSYTYTMHATYIHIHTLKYEMKSTFDETQNAP